MNDKLMVMTEYICPYCTRKYKIKEDAEECLQKCKKLYYKYIKLTLCVNLVNDNYEIREKDEYDYFQKIDEFEKHLKKINAYYCYGSVEFSAYCTSRNQIEKTKERLLQYFIDWCMNKANSIKTILGKESNSKKATNDGD